MSGDKFDVDADAIRELAGLLDETGLTEIELENGDRKLRVARGTIAVQAAAPLMASSPSAALADGASDAADSSHPGAVNAPMVGTVFLAPEPGASNFVKVGDTVSEGDTLLIIEAMKVMNPIRAPHGGKVTRVNVENGGPVEYGQAMLVIE
jgi:acetyl-CoA carboxylase biotin carboxyl carrier protein